MQLGPQAQTAVAQRSVQFHIGELVGLVEHIHVEQQGARDAVLDLEHGDGLREVQARREHVDTLRGVGAFPQGIARVEPDLAILVIRQVAPAFGDLGAGGIGFGCHFAGTLDQCARIEPRRCAELQAGFVRPSKCGGCRGKGRDRG